MKGVFIQLFLLVIFIVVLALLTAAADVSIASNSNPF
jgi:hypothetical protein